MNAQIKKYLELAEKATPGPWTWMFIGGPLNPKRIDVSTVGREGSHHIEIRVEDEFVKTGYFGVDDDKFIAASRTMGPALAKALIRAVENLQEIESYEEHLDGMVAFSMRQRCTEALADIEAILGGRE